MVEASPIELSVILPACNEEASVAGAIETYLWALVNCSTSFELIVIDDGSTDGTLAEARRGAADRPEVRVLSNETNLGQVATILRGLREARGEFVMHNGVDLPFDPADTDQVLARLRDGADVVVVERAGRQAYGGLRKLVSWGNVLLVRLLFGSPITDHNFVQAYRRRVIDEIEVESRGVSTVTTELILKSLAAGFRVERLPAAYHRRSSGESSVTFKKIAHTVCELVRLRMVLPRRSR
ncbi:MAG TPA: glycosyltransferase family 2 protein [Pirellulales bacterium]|jgi:dolichol-phosphate mannosyltransferase|nr:glycosyltransferase family 2 protein [Pirellulales bacterium]